MAGGILIAEDDADILEAVQVNLELAGFRVHTATDGSAALEQARALRPDLVILDIVMPGIDGVDVCRQLKENDATRDVPVIFLTAKATGRDAGIALTAGADGYISKPFDPTDLVVRVRKALAQPGSRAT